MENYYTAKQALDYLKEYGDFSRQSLYRWAKKGKIRTKNHMAKMFFEKASLEAFAEHLMDKSATETPDEPSEPRATDPDVKERSMGDEAVTLNKDLIGSIRHEAYESGIKEGRLLLMGEKEKVQEKNAELEKEREVLRVNKEFLEKALKDERVQKYFALGFFLVWVVGWAAFYVFRLEFPRVTLGALPQEISQPVLEEGSPPVPAEMTEAVEETVASEPEAVKVPADLEREDQKESAPKSSVLKK